MFISHYVQARVGPHIYGLYMKYTRYSRDTYIHGVLASDVRGGGEESKRHAYLDSSRARARTARTHAETPPGEILGVYPIKFNCAPCASPYVGSKRA